MSYMPNEIKQLNVPIKVYRKEKKYISGVPKTELIPINDPIIMCNFKTYGGTEKQANDVLVIYDTAKVTTWFRPDITSDCVIEVLDNGKKYEIKNEPENFELRNQYMQFIVERINPNV